MALNAETLRLCRKYATPREWKTSRVVEVGIGGHYKTLDESDIRRVCQEGNGDLLVRSGEDYTLLVPDRREGRTVFDEHSGGSLRELAEYLDGNGVTESVWIYKRARDGVGTVSSGADFEPGGERAHWHFFTSSEASGLDDRWELVGIVDPTDV